jgi:hypothetical protein
MLIDAWKAALEIDDKVRQTFVTVKPEQLRDEKKYYSVHALENLIRMASESEILQYLKQNDFLDVYVFLINSADNLRNRGILLKNSVERLEEKIAKALEKVEENPDIDPRSKEISNHIKDIHYAELEVIQRLNIMIELLAVYYHLIRTNLRELSSAIGKTDISARELHREFAYFREQTSEDIWRNLKYPNVESFSELSSEEKRILKGSLEESAKQIEIMFNTIFEFQERSRPVYNKYKHTLSEVTGIYGINKEAKRLETQIYMRIKQNRDVQTYIVGAGWEEAKYFREVSAMTYEILRVLIDSALLYLVNLGRDFIPRTLFIKDDNNIFPNIASKIKSCRIPNFESLVEIPVPNPETLKKFNREIQEHHVFLMNKDIMNPSDMLKGGIKLTGKAEVYIKKD